MSLFILLPTAAEKKLLTRWLKESGYQFEDKPMGNLMTSYCHEKDIYLIKAGLGKIRFAVTAQHLADQLKGKHSILCMGAAGSLTPELEPGDLIAGSWALEYDLGDQDSSKAPRWDADSTLLQKIESMKKIQHFSFALRMGGIASGDGNINNSEQRERLYHQCGALAVSWEGAAGAWACQFSRVPYMEIRAITDRADGSVQQDFHKNLDRAMSHLALFLNRFNEEHP